MKIKFGSFVTDGRGKIGGHVASKNRAGSYLRTKVTPVNPQTSFQMQRRSLFGSLAQSWSGLTQTVRDGFNNAVTEWARTDIFGDIKNPTGQTLYIRLNQSAQNAGHPAIASVPAKLPMVDGVISAASVSISDGEIVLTGAYTGVNARTVLYATGVVGDGISFVKNRFRQIFTSADIDTDSIAAYNVLVARFGVPVAGDVIWLGVRYVLPNGQQSPMQVIRVVVSA